MEQRLDEPSFGFRLAETPLIIPAGLREKLVATAQEILTIIRKPEMVAAGVEAVPARYRVPGLDPSHEPQFVAIDLAIVREADGALAPRLIELQGFSSL